MLNVYEPYFTPKSLSYAHDAIDSTWVSSHGKYLSMAEEKLKEITGSKYIILTNNGTSATHLVAHALQYRYAIVIELVVPSNVYIAAWNMMITGEAPFFLKPVDSDWYTWNANYDKLTEAPQAFLVVHNLGNIVNVPKLKERFPTSLFIEDNCEGFLGSYSGRPSGTASIAYSISFFGNKNITSGEGGALGTDDEDIYNWCNSVRAHGATSEKFVFDKLGYNYRMTNVQAALLYGQLEMVEEIKSKKQEIFDLYKKELQHECIEFQRVEEGTTNPNWMLGVRVRTEDIRKFQYHLQTNDIETRPMFPPINFHKHLERYGSFHVSAALYDSVVVLPSHANLTKTEIKYICKTIKNYLK